MPASSSPVIRNFPLISGQYVPIVAPIDCNYFFIIGNGDAGATAMQRSSDGTDANSYTMPAGGWYAYNIPTNDFPRFKKGDVVTWLKALSGSGPAIVEFS